MENGLTLATAIQWFEDAEEASNESREKASRDRDFYDGKQWTEAETTALEKRGQPPIVINRIKRKVDYLLGYERKLRADPRALPRTPMHEQDAEAATDALRFAMDRARFSETASGVWEELLVEGAGACLLTIKQGRDAPQVVAEHIPWDRFFYDPHSRRVDFTDAKYKGLVVWMDAEEAAAMYPKAASIIKETAASDNWGSAVNQATDDRPRWKVWTDPKRARVKLVEIHYREAGQWWSAVLCRGGWVAEPQPSPFKDDDGESLCQIVAVSAYCDRDNNRYGVVRDMIGPQEEINKRRSKALHLLSVRQVIAEHGAVADEDKARREMAKPDGFVTVTPGLRFEVQQTGDMAAAQFNLLQEAKGEIDLIGPNAALQGKQEQSLSGRAMLAQQQGGSVEMEAIFGRFKAWKMRVYRVAWAAIRQFWTAPMWIRVTDDERNVRFVGLNQPPRYDERAGQIVPSPQIATLDVDIILDETPDMATLVGEQFDTLAKLVQAGVPIPPDLLIEASALRNKKEIVDRMKGAGQDPQQAEMARIAAEMKMKGEAAKIDETRAKAAKAEAEARAVETQTNRDQFAALASMGPPPGF